MSKVTNSSNSSPKDYQAINRLFALTLKNLIIYFVNIVDYKDLCDKSKWHSTAPNAGMTGFNQNEFASCPSAVQHIFSKILVNKMSDHENRLITLDDIKRYKATNFEDFPECFSQEDWKVTFFHNKEINQILGEQINSQMVEELFQKRRHTYGKGINEMIVRSEKTKEDIQKRIHSDTCEKIGQMSEEAGQNQVRSKLQIYVQRVHSTQLYSGLKAALAVNKGLWRKYGPRYFKVTNKGFSGFGLKAFLKERACNAFELIKNAEALEQRLFTQVEAHARELSFCPVREDHDAAADSRTCLFAFFENCLSQKTITTEREDYIQFVKMAS